jgi:hypothetical protein
LSSTLRVRHGVLVATVFWWDLKEGAQAGQGPGVDDVVGGEPAGLRGGEPKRRTSRCGVAWASLVIANFTPYCLAHRMCSSRRSSRSGKALISSAVPVRTQARKTSSKPASSDGRRPMILTKVLAGADQPPGHLVPRRQGEQGVHRRDAQVEPGQELVRPVDPLAVDVQLGAVQQAHPAMFPVELHSDRMRSCPTSP